MRIKKIILKNIRSYINQELNLDDGITLLSGDIGSGKSTILLALDFALFGLRKSNLSGSALLRQGETKGSVELYFEIENQLIIIKRTLKKTKTSITQDSGYIIKNGEKKQATPIELKQEIITLLNYPPEFLTKTKSIIYRYTVYTPQEEMKQILLGDKDSRLQTLRKVFDIDKYKRIQENTKILITHLKSENKQRAILISDLNEKENQLNRLQKKELEYKSELHKIPLDKTNFELELIQKQLQQTESQIKELNELKNRLNLQDLDIKHKTNNINSNNQEINNLQSQIKELQIQVRTPQNNLPKLEYLKQLLDINESEKQTTLNKLTEAKTKVNLSEQLKQQIQKLDNCPTCKQKVTQEHIKQVLITENNLIQALNLKITNLEFKYTKYQEEIFKIKLEIDKVVEQQNQFRTTQLKKEVLIEKQSRSGNLQKINTELQLDIQNKTKQRLETETKISGFKDLDTNYNKIKENLKQTQQKQKQLEHQSLLIKKDLEFNFTEQNRLQQEINKKIKTKNKLEYWSKIQHWLSEHFINLMSTIEKKIMLKVHTDFDILFQKWFYLIIDNELLQVNLDKEFTPIVIQNSHNIDYTYLSGGEKTAIALAYRVALNQVINKIKSHIKTKDLIILDEPTDGFSTEQLDRLKFIFEELDISQILIVSHEPKIESFADNIIRLEKQNHITRII